MSALNQVWMTAERPLQGGMQFLSVDCWEVMEASKPNTLELPVMEPSWDRGLSLPPARPLQLFPEKEAAQSLL